MAGADMSKNLGGMLSQTAGALGNMGSTYGASLGRNIENMSRPDTDPTDIASQQALMQWQNNMGRTQEATNTARNVQTMQANQQKAAKAAAVQSSANLTSKLRVLINDPSKPQAEKDVEIKAIQRQLTDLSSLVGRDLSGTSAALEQQKTQIQQASAREERAQSAAEHAKLQQDLAAADKEKTNEFFQQKPEDRAKFIADLKTVGSGALAAKLEDRMRADVRWEEEQAKASRAESERNIPAVTAGERTLINTDLATLKKMNEGLSTAWEAKIKGIEGDPVLSNTMKRQQIAKQRTALGEFITRQTSASMTAERRLANKSTDLKTPAQGLYISDGNRIAPAVQAVAEVMGAQSLGRAVNFVRSGSVDIDQEQQDIRDWVDSVGEQEAARISAAIVTTYPEMTYQQALTQAAASNIGGPMKAVSAGPADNAPGSKENPIVLGKQS